MRRPKRAERDAGVSLVEVLVGLGLLGLLTTLLLGFVLGTSKVTNDTRQLASVNEESRLAMERLTRELRQANAVLGVELAPSGTSVVALTFWIDFNGNNVADVSVSDPEVLTYRWAPTTKELTLTANDASGSVITRPVLAVNVSNFKVDLFSSLWAYDRSNNGMPTTWRELDAAGPPVGNDNALPNPVELQRIDLVSVSMTVLDGSHAQTYSTQVALRNRSQS